jgi:hypothetical protein
MIPARYVVRSPSSSTLTPLSQIAYFNVELVASYWGMHKQAIYRLSLLTNIPGSGTYHDVVRITKEDTRASWIHAEITPILAFVEGVCGYDLYKAEGDWIFRRTVPFV